jgi:diguanylate cyclase (GGDEF)-like protein
VATRIIELARDPDVDLIQVAKALSMDSALASKILRIANSPLYAQRRKSENLRQALMLLGLNATLTLALSFSLAKSLRAGKSNGINFPLYWRRALLAATAARALADAMRHAMAEEIFLAGLLQDIGILALDRALPDLYRGDALQHDHTQMTGHEKKRLQSDHAEIGGWLMSTWHLPERLCMAIAHSHQLEESATTDPESIFERCVALSGSVADLFLMEPPQREFEAAALSAQRSLGLDKMAFGQVLATVGAMIPETEAIFETDLLANQDPELILEQAREVLMLRSLQALREINTLRAAAESYSSCALELEEASRRDALTGVYNRAHLDPVLALEFDSATRRNRPLSLAFADLDHFKGINDTFGHRAGDRILQATARLLRGNTRDSDIIARYGGGQFVVMFPGTDAELARTMCERIVAAFHGTGDVIGAEHTTVTLSIGYASHGLQTSFTSAADFVKAAGEALYTAKMRGGNRSVAFDRRLSSAVH